MRESGFLVIGVAVIATLVVLIALSLNGRYWNAQVVGPESGFENAPEDRPEGST